MTHYTASVSLFRLILDYLPDFDMTIITCCTEYVLEAVSRAPDDAVDVEYSMSGLQPSSNSVVDPLLVCI